MEEMGRAALGLVIDLIEGLPEAPVARPPGAGRLAGELLAPPAREPRPLGELLETLERAIAASMNTASPGYMAFVPGGGLFASALAELVARAANRYTGLADTAPALVAIEHSVVRWLCERFGLPGSAGGLVTTGGSLATLAALVAARERILGGEIGRGRLYLTAHTHGCVAKAARIAGLPPAALRPVPTDAGLRMDPAALERMVAEDRAAGALPFLVAASAGTTGTGAVDPLPALAAVASREGLWLHVDAAYGGFFQLTARGRAALAGIEAADSIVLDPHKGMFLPYGTGVLLVREVEALRAAHATGGDYLQDLGQRDGLPDYAHLGPELTREWRGLRLWLPLQLHGAAAFERALDEKLDLAARVGSELGADPRLELPWPSPLSTVAFRPRSGGDAAAARIQERVNAGGRLLLSSTRVEGARVLRVCILSHRTHADRIDEAIAAVRAAAARER